MVALLLSAGLLCGCAGVFVKMPRAARHSQYEVEPAAVGAYMQGIRARQQGDLRQAQACFAAAHELDPDSLRVLVMLAVSAHEAGMKREARPLLRRAEDAAEKNPELAIIMARFYAGQRDAGKARQFYRIAAQREDLRFASLWEQAWFLEQSGDFEEAEKEYSELADEEAPLARALLGEFYMRRGRCAEALEQFARVEDELRYVHREIAVCRAETGDLDGALESLAKYAEFSCPAPPHNGAPEGMRLYEGSETARGDSPWRPFLRVAEAAMAADRPEKALEALQSAFDCGAECAEIWELTGDARRAMGRRPARAARRGREEARDAWRKALELLPEGTDRRRVVEKINSLTDEGP